MVAEMAVVVWAFELVQSMYRQMNANTIRNEGMPLAWIFIRMDFKTTPYKILIFFNVDASLRGNNKSIDLQSTEKSVPGSRYTLVPVVVCVE